MLKSYYDILEVTGYLKDAIPNKLLVYSFYRDFVMNDYRGILTKEDYRLIEQVLDCFYGTECLMSYPDYLKMGKLHCGEITEMAHRLKQIEDSEVVKVIHDLNSISNNPHSDVQIVLDDSDYHDEPENIEDTNVLKMIHDLNNVDNDLDSDVSVLVKEED